MEFIYLFLTFMPQFKCSSNVFYPLLRRGFSKAPPPPPPSHQNAPLVNQKIPPTGLDSHVLRGKEYEIWCHAYLKRTLGIESKVIGGACDEGIDLHGRWHIVWRPSSEYSEIAAKDHQRREVLRKKQEYSLCNAIFGINPPIAGNSFEVAATTTTASDPLPNDPKITKEIVGDGEQFEWEVLKDASEFPAKFDQIYKDGLLKTGGGVATTTSAAESAPPFPEVIVQCKRQSTPLAPSVVREMEGTCSRFGSDGHGEGVIGIIMSTMPSTPSTKKAIMASMYPLLYLQCNPFNDDDSSGDGYDGYDGGYNVHNDNSNNYNNNTATTVDNNTKQVLFESFMNCRLERMLPTFVVGRRFVEGKERPQMYIVAEEPDQVTRSMYHATKARIEEIESDDEYS